MRPETDCGSMKILLKQVYGVHTAKIKSLEDEIEELRKSLQEAETKVKSYDIECKRCVELEEAFNSCKAALHEQSKWFENLGQKFSTSNTTENKISGEKEIKPLNESIASHEEQPSIQTAAVKKMDLSANAKMHFLKNIMSLNSEEFQESLDLSCAPFQKNLHEEYSTLNPDSLVLVPNTLDFLSEIRENPNKNTISKIHDHRPQQVHNIHVGDHKQETNAIVKVQNKRGDGKGKSKKRMSDDTTDFESNNDEKINKENESESCSVPKKLKSFVTTAEVHTNKFVIQPISKETAGPKDGISKNDIELSFNNSSKKSNTPALDVKINKLTCDVPRDSSDKKTVKECINDDSDISKNDCCQVIVSPSLLPLNEKTNTKSLIDPPSSAEDINDFQMSSISKKTSNEGGSWTTCDKKKLAKKVTNPKPIKTSSRFKMQLDSLPLNYKKPSYRQTKLSKTLFQAKPTFARKRVSDVECLDGDEKSSDFETNLLPASGDLPTVSGGKTIDFDATCIPDNFQYEVVSSGNLPLTKSKSSKNRDFENSIMIVKDLTDSEEESSSEMIIEQPAASSKKDKQGQDAVNSNHESLNELKNSFDRLPKKAEPNYKYKEETVRKKCERKQLTAFDCKECEKYYSELGLSDEEKQKRMHKCSRHRAKFAPPPTPEHFWELEFPDTQECKARGYLNETQKVKLKSHRKRPL